MGGFQDPTLRKPGGSHPSGSRIPQGDWKYWAMMALSLFWFMFLAYDVLKSSNTPSVSQWWKAHIRLEQAANPALSSPVAGGPVLKLPYPRQGSYYQLGFDVLAGFPAQTPDMDPTAKTVKVDVPKEVQALDGRKLSVVGFMIPMALDDKAKVLSFILAQSRMTCCYGIAPKLNQWIYVTMAPGKTTEQMMDVPITVSGTLGVGTKFDSQSMGWCLYRMTSDKVDLPKASWF